jgi:rhamnulokinase
MLNHLAIDIGASGGRHIIGTLQNDHISLQEVYRFNNKVLHRHGNLIWDSERLFQEVITGLKKCHDADLIPDTLGVDSWGVDYALLDANDCLISDITAYRDKRTQGMDKRLHLTLPYSEYYRITGIAKHPFNTVYQLMSEKPAVLDKACTFLMIPDYLHFLLTGQKSNEFTNATTTGLLHVNKHRYDTTILKYAGIPSHIFSAPINQPAMPLGSLKREIADDIGFTATVVLPATHDTASAFLAVPANDPKTVYLSSGTWSLLGIETDTPVLSSAACASGFTNEGGYNNTIRFLKNIMGLWILQSIRSEWNNCYTYSEMTEMAAQGGGYQGLFDVNDERFLAPVSMLAEIHHALRQNGYSVPDNDAQTICSVYRSLADCYHNAIHHLTTLTRQTYTSLCIVGGGSQDAALNQFIANRISLPVYAGPTEGTAIGNIAAQMIACGEIKTVQEARHIIATSFRIEKFYPEEA